MDWISVKDRMPEEEGCYFIYAPSADPKAPLYATAWWDAAERTWLWIVQYWARGVTHWCKPQLPKGDSDGR